MTTMTLLPASHIRSPSPPASLWRRADAPETPARSCSSPTMFGKIYQQISQTPSSTTTKTSDAGAMARNRRAFAPTAAFKSP